MKCGEQLNGVVQHFTWKNKTIITEAPRKMLCQRFLRRLRVPIKSKPLFQWKCVYLPDKRVAEDMLTV